MDPPEDEPVRSPQEDLVEDDEDEDGGSTLDPPLSTAQAGYCVSEMMVSSSSLTPMRRTWSQSLINEY